MSSVTGNGIEEFFEAVDASREEYERYANGRSNYNAFLSAAGTISQSLSGRGRRGKNPYRI